MVILKNVLNLLIWSKMLSNVTVTLDCLGKLVLCKVKMGIGGSARVLCELFTSAAVGENKLT